MYRIVLISISLLIIALFACNSSRSGAQEPRPQDVPRIVYEIYPDAWYQEQAILWKKEIEKNPSDAKAWYNYYNANRYRRFEQVEQDKRKNKLDDIIDQMGNAVPDSYEYYLLKYWNNYDPHDIRLIRKAYKINPNRPDTYYPFILHYTLYDKADSLTMFCQKLYEKKDFAPWLLNYNYNVLMSVESDAILFSNGDNDTYPAWILQQVKNIRPDVTVLNISLLPTKQYFDGQISVHGLKLNYEALKEEAKMSGTFSRERFLRAVISNLQVKYPETPLYFGLTVYNDYTKSFKNDLYLVGLSYRLSSVQMDNMAVLKRNLEKRLRLDYLDLRFYDEHFPGKNLSRRMELNYVAPMIMLSEHYRLSGDASAANYWKKRAMQIAERAGKKELVENIQKNKE
ncbi:MAG: hypothetical protein GF313_07645 [Caldithrix sp.]|nr:hypothetical protein [Caldithrix sp.]